MVLNADKWGLIIQNKGCTIPVLAQSRPDFCQILGAKLRASPTLEWIGKGVVQYIRGFTVHSLRYFPKTAKTYQN